METAGECTMVPDWIESTGARKRPERMGHGLLRRRSRKIGSIEPK